MYVTQQDLNTFLSTQLFLVRTLHTQLSYIVASLVIVVPFDVTWRNLGHISQHMCCVRILILSNASLLNIEPRKAIHLLLKHAELFVAQLTHEELLRKTRITGVFVSILNLGHARFKKVFGNAQGFTKLEGVNPVFLLIHHHHDVVSRLVVHHEFAMAIGNDATRGIIYLFEEGVTVGILLIIIA